MYSPHLGYKMILDTNDITKVTTTNAIHVDGKNISN